jgi:hypothetical protein
MGLLGAAHEPYQDAILFDMLVDLAIDEFKPHTRTVEDGPIIQLEILQALKNLQEAAEFNPVIESSTTTGIRCLFTR